MSTLERREYQQTRMVRTLSPQRTISNQNLAEFDSNLDHLLEDLQSSVAQPGGNVHRETTYTVSYESNKPESHERMQYLTAANPTTVVGDDIYNYKPSEKTVKMYKAENYSYNVNENIAPENTRMQNNINKLDSLLGDLQQVRHGTLERNTATDPSIDVRSSHREITTKKTVQRELVYDDDKPKSSTLDRRDVHYSSDGTYGDLRSVRQSSPSRSSTLQKTQTYNYSSDVQDGAAKTEIIETTEPSINPNILANLDPNLLPGPNTKVTTTIKTYTYEIPGTGYAGAVSPKLSDTVYSSNPSTPSHSFAYNKVETNTSSKNLTTGYPGDYIRPVSPTPSGYNKHYVEKTTTKNVVNEGYGKPSPTPVRSGNESYIYNETTTTTKNVGDYPHPERMGSPPRANKQVNIYKEVNTTNTTNSTNMGHPPHDGYPPNQGPVNKTYIVNETHNTTRNVYPPTNGYPPNSQTVIYKHDTHTTNNYLPNHPEVETFDPRREPSPTRHPKYPDGRDVNITYKYTTHHTTTNHFKGGHPDEQEPLLHPMPFPTDGHDTDGHGPQGPPKRLDDLMAEFGNEPPNNAYNAGYNAKQAELAQKKHAEAVTADVQKKEIKDMPKSKNIAGPPVYYPPGHEMFAHKEESAGYRAEGGMMKESGKYKYEAKSSSKEKSSSGMAVVPVCLPLCCGLPCAIL